MVSIIVPVYQVEAYLHRCVDSILAQTCENIQVILVDDGSRDGSGAICDEYAAKDSRILVIHKENGGLSDARNAGLTQVAGQYIMFVDGDDLIHPRAVELMRCALETQGADIADCDIGFFADVVEMDAVVGVFRQVDPWKKMCQKPEFSVCNRLFRREKFEKLRFPVGRIFEDQFVIFKLLQGAKTVSSDDKLYYYYQRNDGLSKQRVYKETYDLLDASLEMLRDIPREQKACCQKFTAMAVERIGSMLGNAYYHDGQYQNCKIEKICEIVRENRSLLTKNATPWQKWMLSRVTKGRGMALTVLMKSYFQPGKWVKSRICGSK